MNRTLTIAKSVDAALDLTPVYAMKPDSDFSPVTKAGYTVIEAWHDGRDLENFIRNHPAHRGPWLVDSYEFTRPELETIAHNDVCTIVIDDLNLLDRYDCDAVINPSPDAKGSLYPSPSRTIRCMGPDYYPLRDEFLALDEPTAEPNGVVVSFGGSDPEDQTVRVLKIVSDLSLPATAVLGPGYMGSAAATPDAKLVKDPPHVARIFRGAELAVCSGGGTALEMAYLGVPAIVLGTANNQIANAKALASSGTAIYLGQWDAVPDSDIRDAIGTLMSDCAVRSEMAMKGKRLVDGKACERITGTIGQVWKERGISPPPNQGIAR